MSFLDAAPVQEWSEARVLDFDVETVAAGFADPAWVPQKITCVAWSWVGSDKVESRICGVEGIYGNPEARAAMLAALVVEMRQATMVTGHNILRFDLPIIQSEMIRLGLGKLPALRAQDTMRFVKTKGLKKGLDNLAGHYRVPGEKLSLDWQQWEDAYAEKGWQTIRDRCESDVVLHKFLRAAMIEDGILKPPRVWTP